MKRKDIQVGETYALRNGSTAKVVDLGPFEKTYNGWGDRIVIDGTTVQTRRTPDGKWLAVRSVLRDGTLSDWIELVAPASLKPRP